MSFISVTPKLDAFVKFCSEQDPMREITHDHGYDHCAVGEFTTNVERRPSDDASYIFNEMSNEVWNVSDDLGEVFRDTINFGFCHPEIATFGGMTEWLHQIQHQVHEAAQ